MHIWQLNDKDINFEAHIEFKDDISLSEIDKICVKVEKILLDSNRARARRNWTYGTVS